MDESECSDTERRSPIKAQKTPGRNKLCPCGSGKKFKVCHLLVLWRDERNIVRPIQVKEDK